MKKTSVTFQYDDTKFGAIKQYLDKKGVDMQTELTKSLDALYNKVVPAQVREYLAMQNGEPLPTQPKTKSSRKPIKPKENNNEGS